MYKLKQELPSEFKIKVNPEESEVLQKHLFLEIRISVDSKYLYIYSNDIKEGLTKQYFKINPLFPIKFKDYFQKVEDFPEKWCILVTEDNYQELNTWMHRNWKNYYNYKDNWTISKKDIKEYFHNDLFDAPLMSFKSSNSTLITTEQFRAKYGDLKPKETIKEIIEKANEASEIMTKAVNAARSICNNNEGYTTVSDKTIKEEYEERKQLRLENEQLKKYNEELTNQVGIYYKQVLMLTEKLETIKKVLQ